MIRHPLLDIYTGALIALGGPIMLMLPHRIFMTMLAAGCGCAGPANTRDRF